MARVTLGGVISSISGSVGSACFRNSPSGTVLYNRPLCSQRGTPAQHLNRSILKAAGAAWGRLDDDIRTAWGSLAKQEYIPSFFSRGRRWTGRQLYTCFYFYAEHQYTPLPLRWLPTPPLFLPSFTLVSQFFNPDWNWPQFDTPQHTQFVGWRPLGLNPVFPADYSRDCVFSCWLSILPAASTSIPRNWTKICPAPRDFPVVVTGGHPRPSGYWYGSWDLSILHLLGWPPGLDATAETPITAPFSCCYSAVCVSDKNISFSGLLWGYPHSPEITNHWIRYAPSPYTDYVIINTWPGNIPTTEV